MSEERGGTSGLLEERLHAYHDGELSGLARRRFERELRRSASLRRELEGLRALREALRAHDARQAGPDLWDAIALRLPAQDAARRPEAARVDARRRSGWWLGPAGALVVSAALMAALLYGGLGSEPPKSGGVVRWIDSGGRSVMVLDDQPDTTIIWVLDGASEGAAWRNRRGQRLGRV